MNEGIVSRNRGATVGILGTCRHFTFLSVDETHETDHRDGRHVHGIVSVVLLGMLLD